MSLPPLDGFSISHALFQWLRENLPEGKTILELGSGSGTAHLCERWDVISVEHDAAFVGRHPSTYIEAPIDGDWYDVSALREGLPSEYDLILVDGPPGTIGRHGFLRHLGLFRDDVPIVFDDTHRPAERILAEEVARVMKRKAAMHRCEDGRTFITLAPASRA
jgi:hypothetical protein